MASPIDIAAFLAPAFQSGSAGKTGANPVAAQASGQKPGQGLQGLFAALLDLAGLAANGSVNAAASDATGASDAQTGSDANFGIQTALARTATVGAGVGMGNLVDIKALLAGLANQTATPAAGSVDGEASGGADPAAQALTGLIDKLKSLLDNVKPGQVPDPVVAVQAEAVIAAITDFVTVLKDRLAPAGASALAPASNDGPHQPPALPPGQRSALFDILHDTTRFLRQFAAQSGKPADGAPHSAPDVAFSARIDALIQRLDQVISADPTRPAAETGGTSTGKATAETALAHLVGATGQASADPAAALQVHILRGGGNAKSDGSRPADTSAGGTDPLLASSAKPEISTPGEPGRPQAEPPKSNRADALAAAAIAPNRSGAGTERVATSSSADTLLAVQAQTTPQQTATAAFKPIAAAYQPPQAAPNLPNIAFEMMHQLRQGNSRFEIRLDPPELGRIDVQMDVDKTGNIHARLAVEKVETLDLLQRDARVLERALQQAGADGARTNLEFSLKHNPFAGQNPGQGQQRGFADLFAGNPTNADQSDETPPAPVIQIYRGTATPGGINLFA